MSVKEFMKANWTLVYRSFMSLCMGAVATWVIAYGINMASTADQRMFTSPEIRMDVEKKSQLYPTLEQLEKIQEIVNSPALKALTDTTFVPRSEFQQYIRMQNNQQFDMLNRYIQHEDRANKWFAEMQADQKTMLMYLKNLDEKYKKLREP